MSVARGKCGMDGLGTQQAVPKSLGLSSAGQLLFVTPACRQCEDRVQIDGRAQRLRHLGGRGRRRPAPTAIDASLYFIGRIRTPWKERKDCPKNARESDAVCTIEVDPRWAPALQGVESCSHLVVLYWMDRSRRDIVLQVPRHYGVQRGTFSLRSPARPNPIAMSVVRLLKIDGPKLSVVGLDCLDGTPLLDIKPYFASTDAVPDAAVGWHKTASGSVQTAAPAADFHATKAASGAPLCGTAMPEKFMQINGYGS